MKLQNHFLVNLFLQVSLLLISSLAGGLSSANGQIVSEENLPKHAVRILGDRRYVFPGTKIHFLDNERVAAFGKHEAAVITLKTGKVDRIPTKLFDAGSDAEHRNMGGRWYVTTVDGNTQSVRLLDVEKPAKSERRKVDGRLLDVSTSGEFLLVDNGSASQLDVIRMDNGKVTGSWPFPGKELNVWNARFVNGATAVAIACTTINTPNRQEGVLFWEFSKDTGELGRELSRVSVPDNIPYSLQTMLTGSMVVFRGQGGNVFVHDFVSNQTKKIAELPASCLTGDIDPGGRWLATTGVFDDVRIFDLGSSREIFSIKTRMRTTSNACFSPDGTMLAVVLENRLRVWDLNNGTEKFPVNSPLGSLQAVAVAPDESNIAVADSRGMVQIWNMKNAMPVEIVQFQGNRMFDPRVTPNFLAFSKTGKYLLAGSNHTDNQANIWDVKTGQMFHRIAGHKWPVIGVAFSGNDQLIATVDRDEKLQVVNGDGALVSELGKNNTAMAFFPDNTHLAAYYWNIEVSGIRIFNLETGQLVQALVNPPDDQRGSSVSWNIAVSSDGKWIATTMNDERIRIWNVKSGEIAHTLELHKPYDKRYDQHSALAFSQDGKTLAASGGGHEIWLFDVESGTEKLQLNDPGYVRCMTFSKNYLVSVSADCHATIWEIPSK